MRNKRNTCTQSRVKATRQAGTRSARFFFYFFYFLKHKNANKETMRQFVCCRFYQQSIITNQVNTCVHGLVLTHSVIRHATCPAIFSKTARQVNETLSRVTQRATEKDVCKTNLFHFFFLQKEELSSHKRCGNCPLHGMLNDPMFHSRHLSRCFRKQYRTSYEKDYTEQQDHKPSSAFKKTTT